jgi:hypothetical protein
MEIVSHGAAAVIHIAACRMVGSSVRIGKLVYNGVDAIRRGDQKAFVEYGAQLIQEGQEALNIFINAINQY